MDKISVSGEKVIETAEKINIDIQIMKKNLDELVDTVRKMNSVLKEKDIILNKKNVEF